MVLGHLTEPQARCHDHRRLHSVQEFVPGGPCGGGEEEKVEEGKGESGGGERRRGGEGRRGEEGKRKGREEERWG